MSCLEEILLHAVVAPHNVQAMMKTLASVIDTIVQPALAWSSRQDAELGSVIRVQSASLSLFAAVREVQILLTRVLAQSSNEPHSYYQAVLESTGALSSTFSSHDARVQYLCAHIWMQTLRAVSLGYVFDVLIPAHPLTPLTVLIPWPTISPLPNPQSLSSNTNTAPSKTSSSSIIRMFEL